MFKLHWLAASLLGSALCAQQALAQVNGGGSTLPETIYQTPGVVPAGFAPYIGSDLGDKEAFLHNDYNRLVLGGTEQKVHWVATESKLTPVELTYYAAAHAPNWGPMIQVAAAATTVAIRFNKPGGSNLNLSVNEVCGIFSGQLNQWQYLASSGGRSGPITLVYPAGLSATSELFTRFLNAKCATSYGPFAVTRNFAGSHALGVPTSALAGTSSAQIVDLVNATDGSIAFIGPAHAASSLAGLEDGSKVARVSGIAPTPANIVNAISTVPAPISGSAPNRWLPVFAAVASPTDPSVVPYPETGYPILGFTSVILSQCYADVTQTTQIRAFLARHYGAVVNNDAVILSNRLLPLPVAWKTAVRNTFVNPANLQSIGQVSICNGIGRPW